MNFGIIRTIESKYLTWIKLLPATVPMQGIPSGEGKGAALPIDSDKWHFIEAINNAKGYEYARSIGKMWINSAYDKDIPYSEAHAESIEDSGNFVSWEEENNGHLNIRAFDQQEKMMQLFDPAVINWHTRPYLFIKATATNFTRQLFNVGKAIDCYLPLIRRTDGGGTGELWLPERKVERFPTLPYMVTVTVTNGLRIRANYSTDSAQIGSYVYKQDIVILAYRLIGASVWGMTDKGWVCLLLADFPGQRLFTTSWVLKSQGVVPASII